MFLVHKESAAVYNVKPNKNGEYILDIPNFDENNYYKCNSWTVVKQHIIFIQKDMIIELDQQVDHLKASIYRIQEDIKEISEWEEKDILAVAGEIVESAPNKTVWTTKVPDKK